MRIPILLDGDTGYGNFNNMQRLVRKLEQRNIAAVCIEDKLFPKTNSFIKGGAQPLAAVMAGMSCLAVECQPSRIEMRLRTRYLDTKAATLERPAGRDDGPGDGGEQRQPPVTESRSAAAGERRRAAA